MTRFEYDNTVRDSARRLHGPRRCLSRRGRGARLQQQRRQPGHFVDARREVHGWPPKASPQRATDPLSKSVACDPVTLGEDACARQFIAAFGKRAFRRPLTTEEAATFLRVGSIPARSGSDFRTGIEMVIETALQSPAFLYRVEFGLPAAAGEQVVRLDAWETASRLSYFLWGSMPDDELFAAAEAGQLATSQNIAVQARRMLDEPEAKQAVAISTSSGSTTIASPASAKTPTLFPEWSPAVGDLMRDETAAFIQDVVFEDAGDLTSLLTAPYTFMNADSPTFYGVAGPTGERSSASISIPRSAPASSRRAACSPSTPTPTRPRRCTAASSCASASSASTMPPPPPNVKIVAARARPELHGARALRAALSQCRLRGLPLSSWIRIGFGFENYDAVGPLPHAGRRQGRSTPSGIDQPERRRRQIRRRGRPGQEARAAATRSRTATRRSGSATPTGAARPTKTRARSPTVGAQFAASRRRHQGAPRGPHSDRRIPLSQGGGAP